MIIPSDRKDVRDEPSEMLGTWVCVLLGITLSLAGLLGLSALLKCFITTGVFASILSVTFAIGLWGAIVVGILLIIVTVVWWLMAACNR